MTSSKIKVQILTDNPKSWILPYVARLMEMLKEKNVDASHVLQHSEVIQGDILCLLSCEKKYTRLHLNKYNLVIHESDLPEGKGWSPLTWQILEGKNEIPITLFEASDEIDGGEIYMRSSIKFNGDELIDELREKQGNATIDLIMQFIKKYPNVTSTPQQGKSTFYPRRGPNDSELNINKSISEQFNLLRTCDNERYPAFFYHNGHKYCLKIYKYD